MTANVCGEMKNCSV